MAKKLFQHLLVLALAALMAVPAAARGVDYTDGGFTETKVQYSFLMDESILVHGKGIDLDFDLKNVIYAGSDLYIPIGAYDTESEEPEDIIATEKQIKNDSVQVSYKVLQGYDHVESVELISGKKEKLKDLPAGMYVKVTYTRDFFPLNTTRVGVRLVLSVNGLSFQDTAVTFECDLRNREEYINRNSVFGALTPAQFRVSERYFGESTFDFGEGVKYTARVKAGGRYYLNLDRTPNPDLTAMYPDAYLEFYDFKGQNDTFASVGRLEMPVSLAKFKEKKTKAEVYAYEIVGAQLRALDLDEITYRASTNKLTLRTQTLSSYVLSSRALIKDVYGTAENDILRSGYAKSVEPEDEPSGAA